MKARVSDVMSRPPEVIAADATFKAVALLLHEHGVGAMPVVDGAGRVIGVLSEADLVVKEERAYLESRPRFLQSHAVREARNKSEGRVVAQLMSSPAVVVTPDTSLQEAARIMQERGLRQLPVVDREGRPLGVVTRSDLLKVFLRSDNEIRHDLIQGLIVKGLGIDPSALTVSVDEGVATIKGTVEFRSDAQMLERLVPSQVGVVGVDIDVGFRVDDSETEPESSSPLAPPLW